MHVPIYSFKRKQTLKQKNAVYGPQLSARPILGLHTILTQFLKINHISCCESFDVGTIFFLTNYTHSLNLHAEGRMHRV